MGLEKIVGIDQLVVSVRKAGLLGECVVFTNGCYDILHPGHLYLLSEAKKLGDKLIVAINSDKGVRGLKGNGRPILSQEQRASVLSHIECVDFVVVFNELTPLFVIKAIRPDVLVKGQDWKENKVIGRDVIESYGGRVVRVAIIPELSTSTLISRIKSL